MKKLLVGLLLVSVSSTLLADCRSKISIRLNEKEDNSLPTHFAVAAPATLIGLPLLMAIPPVGGGVLVAFGSVSFFHELSKRNLKKLKSSIDEAYAYRENGDIGKTLYKLFKKVRKKTDADIGIDEVVDAVISSNENELLCDANRLGSYAKGISIYL